MIIVLYKRGCSYLFYVGKNTSVSGPFHDPFRHKYYMPANNIISSRLICPVCRHHPVALNYYRGEKAYYRTTCTSCIHKGKKVKPEAPNWFRSGYKKKDRCDKCSFKFKFSEQSNVYYVDGKIENVNWTNLKTICLNCQQELAKMPTSWKPGQITPDF